MGLGGGRALLRVNPSLLQGPVSHSLIGLLRKRGEKKKHVGMELGQGGMQCVYAGKGGLKWLEISWGRFRARLAKYWINQIGAWKAFFPAEGAQPQGDWPSAGGGRSLVTWEETRNCSCPSCDHIPRCLFWTFDLIWDCTVVTFFLCSSSVFNLNTVQWTESSPFMLTAIRFMQGYPVITSPKLHFWTPLNFPLPYF